MHFMYHIITRKKHQSILTSWLITTDKPIQHQGMIPNSEKKLMVHHPFYCIFSLHLKTVYFAAHKVMWNPRALTTARIYITNYFHKSISRAGPHKMVFASKSQLTWIFCKNKLYLGYIATTHKNTEKNYVEIGLSC